MSVTTVDGKKFNRWVPVIAGVTMQLCLGVAYIWSVFQTAFQSKFMLVDAKGVFNSTGDAKKAAQIALSFSILLFVMTIGSAVGGRIQDKLRPKPVVMVGGIIMAIGFFLVQFATLDTIWFLWLTYGVIGGFGCGAIYTTVIATCQKWFPDKRGLITGIIVSALGFGGVVFTLISEGLIKSLGVSQTFMWIGIIFAVVTVVGSLFMVNPPEGYKPEGWTPPAKKANAPHVQDFLPSQTLKTPQFYMIFVAFMLACSAGFMVIPFAKDIAKGAGLPKGAIFSAVIIIAAFNSLGRLTWGWVSDRLGRKNTLILLMVITSVLMLLAIVAKSYAMLTLIGAIAFCYGGFLGTFPALTADFFGVKNMGVNYGMILLGFGTGAVIFTKIAGDFRAVKDFSTPFIISSIVIFVAAAIIFFLKHPKLHSDK